jgi:hypothetical protein
MDQTTTRTTLGRAALAAGLGATLLAGCVVVPVNPDGSVYAGAAPAVVAVPAAPAQITLPVRLYPTNDTASPGGMVSGTVTNHLSGKGTFMLNVAGETMSGEATRTGGAGSRSGVANAYGARGSFANCQYTMNSTSQGTGRCTFSNGATYQLHIGS